MHRSNLSNCSHLLQLLYLSLRNSFASLFFPAWLWPHCCAPCTSCPLVARLDSGRTVPGMQYSWVIYVHWTLLTLNYMGHFCNIWYTDRAGGKFTPPPPFCKIAKNEDISKKIGPVVKVDETSINKLLKLNTYTFTTLRRSYLECVSWGFGAKTFFKFHKIWSSCHRNN